VVLTIKHRDEMINATRWMLIALVVMGFLACMQGRSATGASTAGATTEQVVTLIAQAMPEAKRRLLAAEGVWVDGANQMLAQLDMFTVDSLCRSYDVNTTYGWADYPYPEIHFCNMPLARLENASGWILHEGSHAVLDTKDHAYGRAESAALPIDVQLDNAASWGFNL